jgi:hypothetical protein
MKMILEFTAVTLRRTRIARPSKGDGQDGRCCHPSRLAVLAPQDDDAQ